MFDEMKCHSIIKEFENIQYIIIRRGCVMMTLCQRCTEYIFRLKFNSMESKIVGHRYTYIICALLYTIYHQSFMSLKKGETKDKAR